MVSPLEDCMETSVKVKFKSQEKRKAIKLVPQKQTAGRITAEVGLDAKTENYTNVKAEGKVHAALPARVCRPSAAAAPRPSSAENPPGFEIKPQKKQDNPGESQRKPK